MNDQNKALVPSLRFPEFVDAPSWGATYANNAFRQISNKKHNSDLPILAITQEHGAIPREMIDYNVTVSKKSIESYKVVEKGDFIISLRSFQGGIEHSEYKGLCSPAYVVLRSEKGIDKRFFKQYFKTHSFIRDLTKNLEGLRDGKMISYKQFSEVLLPKTSLPEQQKVADCLETIDDLISYQYKKIAALESHKKGLIQKLFPSKGETLPVLRFPEFEKHGDWEVKPLAEVCKIVQGYGFPNSMQGKNNGKYPFCKVSDISRAVTDNGGLLVSAANYVDDDDVVKLRAKLVPIGTTVFAKIGEALRLNRRAFVLNKSLIDNNAVGLKAKCKDTDDGFIFYMSQLIDLNEHCRGAVPSVNKSTLEAIEVVLPQSDEQRRISEIMQSVDVLLATQVDKLNALKEHKTGLTQILFPSCWGGMKL